MRWDVVTNKQGIILLSDWETIQIMVASYAKQILISTHDKDLVTEILLNFNLTGSFIGWMTENAYNR